MKRPSKYTTGGELKKEIHVVAEIAPFRTIEAKIAETMLEWIVPAINPDLLAKGPCVVPIMLPWPSTHFQATLPAMNVEVSYKRDDAWDVQAAINGLCEESDLKPNTLLIKITYTDGKTFGSIATVPEREYFWLATNVNEVSHWSDEATEIPVIKPTPELMIGFAKRDDLLDACTFVLLAASEKLLSERLLEWRDRPDVRIVKPPNPEPPGKMVRIKCNATGTAS